MDSDSVDNVYLSLPTWYRSADGLWNFPSDWDAQCGAQEGDQVATSRIGGLASPVVDNPAGGLEVSDSNTTASPNFPPTAPHEFSLPFYGGDYYYSNASDTTFTSGEVTWKDQGPAIGTTQDNHDTTSSDLLPELEAVHCSGSGQSLPSTGDGTNACACISCFLKARIDSERRFDRKSCIVGCSFRSQDWNFTADWRKHLPTHFFQDEKYHCKFPRCNRTFGRWEELTRHDKTHCLRPTKFACDVLDCKYSGNNGFLRHDKLLSHKRNVHDGKAPPGQLMRELEAKPQA
ncbi:hypothetical protein MMC07_001670 [Pseudocyphellaria aurata]|nr:hypothetical protein [Pseudocyphellaria aurata]